MTFGDFTKHIDEMDSLRSLDSVFEWVLCSSPGERCILDGHKRSLHKSITLAVMKDVTGVYLAMFYGHPLEFAEVGALVLVTSPERNNSDLAQKIKTTWSSTDQSRTLLVGPIQPGTYCFEHIKLGSFDHLHLLIQDRMIATLASSTEEILSSKLCVTSS